MKTAIILAFGLFGCSGTVFDTVGGDFDSGVPAIIDGADVELGVGGASTDDAGAMDARSDNNGGASAGGARDFDGSAVGGAPSGGTVGAGGAPSGGAIGTGGVVTCTIVTHENGLGQTWQDCTPLGTHDEDQAMKACAASGATSCVRTGGCNGAAITANRAGQCGVWGYEGEASGLVRGSSSCVCPGPGVGGLDLMWN